MNILYLAHRIPFPPDKGDKIRSFRQLEHLSARHKVWCACFYDTPSDEPYVKNLDDYCEEVIAIRLRRGPATLRGLAGLSRGGTLTEAFYNHEAMWTALREWFGRVSFDTVVAFSSSMAPYALKTPQCRRVLDLCDLDSYKWRSYAAQAGRFTRKIYRLEGKRLAIRERIWVAVFDATILITKAEASSLERLADPTRLHVVGNGVILPETVRQREILPSNATPDATTPVEALPADDGAERASVRPPTVGFVGMMDYRPNIDAVCWFVNYSWPYVRDAFPGSVFRIVGRNPVKRVSALSSKPGVEVVGGVDDVNTEVRDFDVSVAPIRIARGLQNKVLEAMAAGKPVVLTGKAADGIDATHGEDFVVANEPERIAQEVIHLLKDPARRKRIGASARHFVATHHRWADFLRKFELIVTGACEQSAPRSLIAGAGTTAPNPRDRSTSAAGS